MKTHALSASDLPLLLVGATIAFTAGIGEHSSWVRSTVCGGMTLLELTLNIEENENSPVDRDIATVASAVRVLVVKARED